MKQNLHPPYYQKATVSCACGNTFTVGSTKEHLEVEICSQCHPFYTGQEKVVDTAGRVERYRRLVSKARTLNEKKGTYAKKGKGNEKGKRVKNGKRHP